MPEQASAPHPDPLPIVKDDGEREQRRAAGTASAARIWAPLARFIEAEARIGDWAERRPATHALYEFGRFGIKQGWACLFGR